MTSKYIVRKHVFVRILSILIKIVIEHYIYIFKIFISNADK